jgi:uncharacterized protein
MKIDMSNEAGYYFHYREHYFSIQKEYTLLLKKTSDGIRIVRQEKNNDLSLQEYHMDNSERISGKITAKGVWHQLSNIKNIVFEVTDACNLQCAYCIYGKFYGNYDRRKNQYMDIHKAKILLDEIIGRSHSNLNASQHTEMTISFYGGEPLMNMDFIQNIVEYTQSKTDSRIGFKYNMTTNGVYLKKRIDFLVRYDFQVLVSLDGSKTNDGHRKFTNGKPSFKLVYDNLLYVRSNYPEFFKNKISFNSVLHNLNNEQEVFRFFKQQFDKVPLFSDVSNIGVRTDMQQAFETVAKQKEIPINLYEAMEKELDLDSAANKSLQHFIFRYSGNIYKTYNSLLQKPGVIKYLPTGTCFPFSKKIFMTVNGKLLPCERIGHQFVFGQVTEQGVEIDCEEIARKQNDYYDSVRKQCVICYRVGGCTKCMFHIKNLDKIPVCDEFLTKSAFEKYLQGKIHQLSKHPELYKRIIEEVSVMD